MYFHWQYNREIKCKLNCQCVLRNNEKNNENEKGGGGGSADEVPNLPPLVPPFKVVQIRLLPCTIKTIRESTLGINHNALLLYIR